MTPGGLLFAKQTPRARRRRRLLRILATSLGAVLVLLAAEEVAFRLYDPSVIPTGPSAIWLRHSWIDDDHSAQDYRALAARLDRMGIDDVFFHAGPLDGDGSVSQAKLDGSARLIRNMRKLSPGVRFQPWLGQVAEFGGGGPLDLRSQAVRAEIVRTAGRFLDLGADGFHIDLEPIYSGDRDYVQLLRELHRVTKTHRALLSVAAYKPEEFPGLDRAARLIARNPGYWTRSYFLQVAREVDQVAVMSYDSGIPLPGLYGRSVAWIAEWAVTNGVESVYVGIPTYEAGGGAHFAWAENIDSALRGLRLGVSRLGARDRSEVGAAIFAEWTTSPSEERAFRRSWARRRAP